MATKADEGEVLGEEPVDKIEAAVRAALRRKRNHEDRLAGALRALAPHSARLSALSAEAVETLVRRGAFSRPLYVAAVRSVAELDEGRASELVAQGLAADDAGGLATLSAACFVRDPGLSAALARVAASRHPHLAFAAEVARVARGESDGEHVALVAPKIKESHRIALCGELFVPLLHHRALPLAVAPALAVLRDAERHLGRWLVFAEIAHRAGDRAPLSEARARAASGASSARAAWTFVAWALSKDADGVPSVRPTVELISRLSDRPSADRDPTFLYRLAEAGVKATRPMLENLVKGSSLKSASAVRAAMYLARDHGRDDLLRGLSDVAAGNRQEAVRGLAAAAVHDLGGLDESLGVAESLLGSRQVSTLAWACLLRAAKAGRLSRVISEPAFRRIQLGWVE